MRILKWYGKKQEKNEGEKWKMMVTRFGVPASILYAWPLSPAHNHHRCQWPCQVEAAWHGQVQRQSGLGQSYQAGTFVSLVPTVVAYLQTPWQVEAACATAQEQDDLLAEVEIPDEFMDPLMATLMTDPVSVGHAEVWGSSRCGTISWTLS